MSPADPQREPECPQSNRPQEAAGGAGGGPRFVLREACSEDFELLCNGEHMGRYSHDSHGWEGMGAVRDLVQNIARVTGGTVDIESA
ncbi:hypothetical protein D3C71_19340 [compost metagenome]